VQPPRPVGRDEQIDPLMPMGAGQARLWLRGPDQLTVLLSIVGASLSLAMVFIASTHDTGPTHRTDRENLPPYPRAPKFAATTSPAIWTPRAVRWPGAFATGRNIIRSRVSPCTSSVAPQMTDGRTNAHGACWWPAPRARSSPSPPCSSELAL
jgi:hypothetical protein